MARFPRSKHLQELGILLLQLEMMEEMYIFLLLNVILVLNQRFRKRLTWDMYSRLQIRSLNMHKMLFESDVACVDNCRMDLRSFHKLCMLLTAHGGLKPTKNMEVEELVAMFLHIIAHDERVRVVKRLLAHSSETITRQFRTMLHAVLHLHPILFAKPESVPENYPDDRWKCFKVL